MNENTVKQTQVDKMLEESEVVVSTLWGKCTVVAVQLPNGFTIVEHSGAVDPANYDENIGKEVCLEKIKNEIWRLEGYKLQCELGRLD
ncbi:Gp49 family protein [Clostridium sp.]|uniref:Gp49 family protein n=1 Tax=Clostridium sp. TaxID=1506 RepID=UPI0032176713